MTVAEKIHELARELLPCLSQNGEGSPGCKYPVPASSGHGVYWCENCARVPELERVLRKAYDFGAEGLLDSRQKVSELVGKLNAVTGGEVVDVAQRWAGLYPGQAIRLDDLYDSKDSAENCTCQVPMGAGNHKPEDCEASRKAAGIRIVPVKVIVVEVPK